jgi:hypothetical protein
VGAARLPVDSGGESPSVGWSSDDSWPNSLKLIAMIPKFKSCAATGPDNPLLPFDFDPGFFGCEPVEIMFSHCGICLSDLSMMENDFH